MLLIRTRGLNYVCVSQTTFNRYRNMYTTIVILSSFLVTVHITVLWNHLDCTVWTKQYLDMKHRIKLCLGLNHSHRPCVHFGIGTHSLHRLGYTWPNCCQICGQWNPTYNPGRKQATGCRSQPKVYYCNWNGTYIDMDCLRASASFALTRLLSACLIRVTRALPTCMSQIGSLYISAVIRLSCSHGMVDRSYGESVVQHAFGWFESVTKMRASVVIQST